MEFKTKHNLPFEAAEWISGDFMAFRVGSCGGLWASTDNTYDILAVVNDTPGNGHLEDVFEWFENSCKRDKKNLRVLEVWNKRFEKHLIDKRGFSYQNEDNLIKYITT